MDPVLAPADNKLSDQASTINAQQQIINGLRQQLAGKSIASLYGIQSVMPEILWYEARDPNAPKTGPHGTINIIVGEPTVVDFHPIVLVGGHSDNVYCLRREYNRLSEDQKTKMELAGSFDIGCEVALDPLSNVQAFEWDYQIRKSIGVVINVGLQLLPDGTLRGFDFVNKNWVQLGPKIRLTNASKVNIRVYATCDNKVVQFTKVVTDGVESALTFSHIVSTSQQNSPYCNAAYQLDARTDGKAYKATVGHLSINFS